MKDLDFLPRVGVFKKIIFTESDRESLEKLLNINLLAVAVCINKAVGSMRKRNVEGHVVNINRYYYL